VTARTRGRPPKGELPTVRSSATVSFGFDYGSLAAGWGAVVFPNMEYPDPAHAWMPGFQTHPFAGTGDELDSAGM
jgi:hypothetical protein